MRHPIYIYYYIRCISRLDIQPFTFTDTRDTKKSSNHETGCSELTRKSFGGWESYSGVLQAAAPAPGLLLNDIP